MAAVRRTLAGRQAVLAVSGGADSMVLLHAAARSVPEAIAAVATFDHGTGPAAEAAVALVQAAGAALGVPVRTGRAATPARTEAGWRRDRWAFLRSVGDAVGAPVATAHTEDDQLETILLRFLRGAGARGLAALAAPGPVLRPLLHVDRAAVRHWATTHAVPFVDDPANVDRRHARVRVRHDLLPAIERASPATRGALLDVAGKAAAWRRDLAHWVDGLGAEPLPDGAWRVPATALDALDDAAQALLWPELASRVGAVLSSDGTRRAVRFMSGSRVGAELRWPGGATVVRVRGAYLVRPAGASEVASAIVPGEPPGDPTDPRWCAFPAGAALVVRPWQPGDRIVTGGAPAARRIARYLAEAGVPAPDRRRWPVVWYDGAPAWVPGVCRGSAASFRPDRPDLIWYRSARHFG